MWGIIILIFARPECIFVGDLKTEPSQMKRYTYHFIGERQDLLCEEDVNEQGLVVFCRDYGTDPVTDRLTTYDEKGYLLEEIEICEEEEINRIKYVFSDDGEMLLKDHYISGELYEKRTVEYTADGFIRTTVTDGEETEKMISRQEGEGWISSYYIDGELREIQKTTGSKKEGKEIVEYFDHKNVFFRRKIEYYDSELKLVKTEIYNRHNKVEEEYTWEYDKLLPIKETLRFPEAGKSERAYTINWEYDELGNVVKKEVKDEGGRLLEFHLRDHDELGRVIEERGLAGGKVLPVYAAAPAGRFHYTYSYDKYGKAMTD
jgi:hypothetical protein